MSLGKRALLQWDRVGGVTFGLSGLGVLIAGCIRVSAAADTRNQLSYLISGGILGLFLLAVGCTLWLSADLRDAWRKVDRLQRSIEGLVPAAVEIALPAAAGGLVSGADMTLFHRPDCQLVTGKPVEFAGRATHEGQGRQACGVCAP